MKKRNMLYGLLLGLGICASCSDWLDVKSSTQIIEKDLYTSYDGYRNALNGIYRLMSHEHLYGRELTWGFNSFLGHNYSPDLVHIRYAGAMNGEYTRKEVADVIDRIYAKGYNAIAHCNNLIKHTIDRDPSFFPQGEVEKNLLLAEARGLRALMHFDLLRLFAPSAAEDDGETYIPYVTAYPVHQPQPLPLSAALDSVILDLEYCREHLAYNDTTYNRWIMETVEARFEEARQAQNGGLFFSYRGTRMNYVAACGLLARVHLYKGDKQRALQSAREVLKFDGWYPFSSESSLKASPKDRNRKMYNDILMAFYNDYMYDIITGERVTDEYRLKNTAHLYGEDPDDYRALYLLDESLTPFRWMQPDQLTGNAVWIARYQGPLEPVIRKSEVYYIACECLADTDLPQAMELLEKVRLGRGCKTPIPREWSKELFLDKLCMEATKEYLTEGQTFYLYKRLNRQMYNGATGKDMTGKYVLPIPNGELSYY